MKPHTFGLAWSPVDISELELAPISFGTSSERLETHEVVLLPVDFKLVSTNPSNPLYRCILYGRKSFRNYKDHAQGKNHQVEVANFLTQQAELEILNPVLTSTESGTGAIEGMDWTHNLVFHWDLGVLLPDETYSPEDSTTEPNVWDQDNSGIFEKQNDGDKENDEPEQVQEEEIVYEAEKIQADENHTEMSVPCWSLACGLGTNTPLTRAVRNDSKDLDYMQYRSS
ncbi:hypothetical protein CROQUDRAFT_86695 [Cronartium quercuum f. sp. fusiforme G11]|uniref:Uncharacterized protein n=1 Tax=Cronartium quercuum f. sp. fusiforme G11 TaxID=708437 RepID=A0A9P6TGC9_9BASI|nr:hypothetical protein CROQUDRAFT_86695 [Cronartium quercuum f. sp. fusiforme G11]